MLVIERTLWRSKFKEPEYKHEGGPFGLDLHCSARSCMMCEVLEWSSLNGKVHGMTYSTLLDRRVDEDDEKRILAAVCRFEKRYGSLVNTYEPDGTAVRPIQHIVHDVEIAAMHLNEDRLSWASKCKPTHSWKRAFCRALRVPYDSGATLYRDRLAYVRYER